MRKSTIGMIASGVVLAITLGGFVMVSSSAEAELASQRAQLASLTSRLDAVKSATVSADTAAAEQARGYSAERVAHDEAMATKVFEKLFTWSNFEQYKEARDVLSAQLGVPADDPMLVEFFPEVVPYEDGGNAVDDAGLNMAFKNATYYLTGVGSRYEWLAVIEADVTGDAGNTSTRLFGVTFKTEADNDNILLPAGMILTRAEG